MNSPSRLFLTPGPSQLHRQLPQFLQEALQENIASISHRSKEFEKIYQSAADGVRALLEAPAGTHVFFLGSATEAMERIVQNCCAEQSFHFVNGAFSERFFLTAKELGRRAVECRAAFDSGFDFAGTEVPAGTELICTTHNETSTGVMIDLREVAGLKRRYPEALVAVDIVSSAPYPKVPFDSVDAVFFSVQKSFGMPAGLGVLVVNDACLHRAKELQKSGLSVGSYHNFPTLESFAQKNQTPETPNVLAIYLLSRVCAALRAEGIQELRTQTDARAAAVYSFLDAHPSIRPFVSDPSLRSATLITASAPKASELVQKLGSDGIEVGTGYAQFKDQHIRIANFCTHSMADMQRLIAALG